MNVEVLSQQLKRTILRHYKTVFLLLFGALALLLYLTTLLSQASSLSDTFVDVAIYIIYILLVLILGSITFVGYSLLEEESLVEISSYTPQRDVLEIESLLDQKEEVFQEKVIEKPAGFAVVLNRARESLISGSTVRMKGYLLVEESEPEQMAEYLSQQHPQITAVTLLMIKLNRAETILEQFEISYRDDVLISIEESDTVSQEAVQLLDKTLQQELSPLYEECLSLAGLQRSEVREILRHVDKKELMFALKGATQELQESFFANMSSKASTEFKNALRSLTHIEQTKSQNAVKNLYLLAEQLRENGKIRAIN